MKIVLNNALNYVVRNLVVLNYDMGDVEDLYETKNEVRQFFDNLKKY